MRIASLFAGAIVFAAPLASAQTVDRSETRAMVAWINQARAEGHAEPLAQSATLDAMAEAHSMDMATHQFFSHQSPTTGSVGDRAQRAQVQYRMLAENIALDSTPRAAHEALLRSPGHRANIMDTRLRSVGIGIVRSGRSVYVTQVFATLLQPEANAPVAAAPAAPSVPTVTAGSAASPSVAQVPANAPAPTEDEGDEDSDGDTQAPAVRGAPMPTAPVPQAAPGAQVPTAQAPGAMFPGMPWLTEFLTPFMTPAQPAQPGAAGRATRQPAPTQRPGRHGSQPRTYDIQTPLGPMRVTVSGEGFDPSAMIPGAAVQPAAPAAPATPTHRGRGPHGTSAPAPAPTPAPEATPTAPGVLAPTDWSGMI